MDRRGLRDGASPRLAGDGRLVTTSLHDSLSALVFFGFPAAGIAVGRWFRARGERGWAGYLIISGFAFLGGFVFTSLGFEQVADSALADVSGLLQGITLVVGFACLTVLGVKLRSLRGGDLVRPGDGYPKSSLADS